MKQKWMAWILCTALLLTGVAMAEPVAEHAVFSEYGKVISVTEDEQGAYIEAEGYYGYHMEDEPSVTVGVSIGKDGLIKGAAILSTKAQTPGFPEMIDPLFLSDAYRGQNASNTLEVDGISGATVTWTAVQYAVRSAAHYAQAALGYNADTASEEKAELNAVYAAAYTTIETEYKPDDKEQGVVLYAAEGIAPDGTEVVAMKVRGSRKVAQKGSAATGWDAAMPGSFTMIVVVDKAQSKVIAWQMVKAGTREPDYFTIPDETIDTYMTVTIETQEAFDEFTDGLIYERGFEMEQSEDGPIITGTTIVYTGATEQGEFGTQMVRLCFKTAAYFYANYK